jgi:hypothetical protein
MPARLRLPAFGLRPRTWPPATGPEGHQAMEMSTQEEGEIRKYVESQTCQGPEQDPVTLVQKVGRRRVAEQRCRCLSGCSM